MGLAAILASQRSLAKKGLGYLIFGGLIFTASLWLLFVAAAAYGMVYHYYIPQSEIRSGVHFDFYQRDAPANDMWQSLCIIDIVDLPLSQVDYSLDLALELQRSSRNRDAGNFVVTVSLVKKESLNFTLDWPASEKIIRSAKDSDNVVTRSGILPYMSPLLETLHTLTFAPLYVFGIFKQTSHVNIVLFDKVKSLKRNYDYAVIWIKTRVDLEDASLLWKPRLFGIRYLMLTYPIMSFFAGTFFVWFWELAVTFGTVVYIRSRSAGSAEDETDVAEETERIEIPRRSVSRRQFRSSPPHGHQEGSPAASTTLVGRQSWAREFEASASGEDLTTTLMSDTAEAASTPETTFDEHYSTSPRGYATGSSVYEKGETSHRGTGHQ